jgi:hypothetical protein
VKQSRNKPRCGSREIAEPQKPRAVLHEVHEV